MKHTEPKYDEYGRKLDKKGRVPSEQTRIPQMDDRGLLRIKLNKKGKPINNPNIKIERLDEV